MLTPPWTNPARLASVISINWINLTWLSAADRGERVATRGILREGGR
jgi:hypothetical protein